MSALTMATQINLYLLLAMMAANLPFVWQRIGGLVAVVHKRLPWRLLEFLLLYLLIGLLGRVLESRLMLPQPQGWAFYVVTFSLFCLFAFPGVIYRYCWRQVMASRRVL